MLDTIDDVVVWPMTLGSGWHEKEYEGDEQFRWVSGEATVHFVSAYAIVTIAIDAEPGPGVAELPAQIELQVGDVLKRYALHGRRRIEIVLAPADPSIQSLTIRVLNGGTAIGADSRLLDLRIFGLTLRQQPRDVVPLWEGFSLRSGWYFLESTSEGAFRWASNEAAIEMNERRTSLDLEIEAGPDLTGRRLHIEVRVGDAAAQTYVLTGRMRFTIAIPPAAELPAIISLRSLHKARPVFPSGRIMNFRAFARYGPSEMPEIAYRINRGYR